MLRTHRRTFGNIIGHARGANDAESLAAWTARQLMPSLTWRDIEWIRRAWDGPLILKGILDPEDARLAGAAGADAIVVSNHGGRQLDGAPASLQTLPAIVDAVGDGLEVYLDSGIRSGQDLMKALALGARGVMIGRAYLYGLGSLGGPGVTRCLEILRNELDLSLALSGVTDVRALGRDHVLEPRW
jgi:L-lactate dehydrogenase (cytochrome)